MFSGASGGRRSASAAVDGATAIPHLNDFVFWVLLPLEYKNFTCYKKYRPDFGLNTRSPKTLTPHTITPPSAEAEEGVTTL